MHVGAMATSRASAAAVRSNLKALRISSHMARSTGLSFSTCTTTRRPQLPPLSPRPRNKQQPPEPQWQHRGYSSSTGRKQPVGVRCLSSFPHACCSLPSSARAQGCCHRSSRGNQQPFCTSSSSSSSSSSSGSSSEPGKLDVHVTHVDAAAAEAGAGADGGDGDGGGEREMMAEEDRQPIGAGGGGAGGEENVVRFLDVPGSEQTREEKMTIVFTCTVCETRTAKTFAKLSYEKGVVIARCPGCHNLHLIADRLGWFEEAGDGAGGWDIQKITNRIGESDCHVVNEDNVMELNIVDIVGKTTKREEHEEGEPPSSDTEDDGK